MINVVKSSADRFIVMSHHLSSGVSGAIAFGFAAYLLDLGGFRTNASVTGHVDNATLTMTGVIVLVFAGAGMLMRRLTGKHGVF